MWCNCCEFGEIFVWSYLRRKAIVPFGKGNTCNGQQHVFTIMMVNSIWANQDTVNLDHFSFWPSNSVRIAAIPCSVQSKRATAVVHKGHGNDKGPRGFPVAQQEAMVGEFTLCTNGWWCKGQMFCTLQMILGNFGFTPIQCELKWRMARGCTGLKVQKSQKLLCEYSGGAGDDFNHIRVDWQKRFFFTRYWRYRSWTFPLQKNEVTLEPGIFSSLLDILVCSDLLKKTAYDS